MGLQQPVHWRLGSGVVDNASESNDATCVIKASFRALPQNNSVASKLVNAYNLGEKESAAALNLLHKSPKFVSDTLLNMSRKGAGFVCCRLVSTFMYMELTNNGLVC